MPKEIEGTKMVMSPQTKAVSGETKMKAKDIAAALETPITHWAGTKVQFGLSDEQFMTETQFKAFVDAFLKVPASH